VRYANDMMRIIGQMMKLPIAAFVYGMDVFDKVIREFQRAANQSIDVTVSGIIQSLDDSLDPKDDAQVSEDIPGGESEFETKPTRSAGDGTSGHGAENLHLQKEEIRMPDTNLSDEMLKLVRYKVLFVKRDYETAFPEVEELVHENMSSATYTGWKIAEFIQGLHNGRTDIPKKWTDYPSKEYRRDGKLTGFPEGDKKYLRVYFEVLDRYVREEFKYEEDQIDVLKEIRDALKDKESGGTPSGGGKPTAGGAAGGGKGTAPR
jgi:hypothetical protein